MKGVLESKISLNKKNFQNNGNNNNGNGDSNLSNFAQSNFGMQQNTQLSFQNCDNLGLSMSMASLANQVQQDSLLSQLIPCGDCAAKDDKIGNLETINIQLRRRIAELEEQVSNLTLQNTRLKNSRNTSNEKNISIKLDIGAQNTNHNSNNNSNNNNSNNNNLNNHNNNNNNAHLQVPSKCDKDLRNRRSGSRGTVSTRTTPAPSLGGSDCGNSSASSFLSSGYGPSRGQGRAGEWRDNISVEMSPFAGQSPLEIRQQQQRLRQRQMQIQAQARARAQAQAQVRARQQARVRAQIQAQARAQAEKQKRMKMQLQAQIQMEAKRERERQQLEQLRALTPMQPSSDMFEDISNLNNLNNLNNLGNLNMGDGIPPAISGSNDFVASSSNVDGLIADLKLELGGGSFTADNQNGNNNNGSGSNGNGGINKKSSDFGSIFPNFGGFGQFESPKGSNNRGKGGFGSMFDFGGIGNNKNNGNNGNNNNNNININGENIGSKNNSGGMGMGMQNDHFQLPNIGSTGFGNRFDNLNNTLMPFNFDNDLNVQQGMGLPASKTVEMETTHDRDRESSTTTVRMELPLMNMALSSLGNVDMNGSGNSSNNRLNNGNGNVNNNNNVDQSMLPSISPKCLPSVMLGNDGPVTPMSNFNLFHKI